MRLIGQMLSMAAAGMILALFIGKAQVTAANRAAFLGGFRAAFLLFAGLCLAGIFASLARGRLHGNPAPTQR
jgi:hypothetical protein